MHGGRACEHHVAASLHHTWQQQAQPAPLVMACPLSLRHGLHPQPSSWPAPSALVMACPQPHLCGVEDVCDAEVPQQVVRVSADSVAHVQALPHVAGAHRLSRLLEYTQPPQHVVQAHLLGQAARHTVMQSVTQPHSHVVSHTATQSCSQPHSHAAASVEVAVADHVVRPTLNSPTLSPTLSS